MTDNRLFSNEILYSEGLDKPYLRGKIHAFGLLMMPVYLLFSNMNLLLIVTIIGNTLCFGTSAAYHVLSWTVEQEIIMQKLDHICISLWCHLMMYPIMFYLLPHFIGWIFFSVNGLLLVCNTGLIIASKPSIVVHTLVPASLAPFLYWCKMSNNAWIALCCVIGFQSIGTIIFSYKKPEKCFHEIYHLLTIGSSISVFLTNFFILSD